MRKSIIISAIIVLFILGTIIGIIMIKNSLPEEEKAEIAEQNTEEIYDECTDEYEEMVKSNTLVEETSSEGEKISPNCSIIFKRHYNDCGHTIEQYASIPTELVNKTEEDLQKQYEGWTIEEFSRNQIILYREFDSECGEHYILREKDGKFENINVLLGEDKGNKQSFRSELRKQIERFKGKWDVDTKKLLYARLDNSDLPGEKPCLTLSYLSVLETGNSADIERWKNAGFIWQDIGKVDRTQLTPDTSYTYGVIRQNEQEIKNTLRKYTKFDEKKFNDFYDTS